MFKNNKYLKIKRLSYEVDKMIKFNTHAVSISPFKIKNRKKDDQTFFVSTS